MLFKLSLRNFKRSAKDFTIYFVTIVVGIATFYAFDSLSCQRILFDIHTLRVDMWDSIDMLMKFFGVAVTFVLSALILYANNFLLKRRKSEFGTYILLGMSPGKVSLILIFETIIIGIVALILGILLGVALSQLMTFATASITNSQMHNYKFLFSISSTFRTISTFAVLFVIVGLFNIVKINKTRLVTLLSRDSAGNVMKVLSRPLSIILFLVSILMIALAYRYLIKSEMSFLQLDFMIATILMLIGTFLLFFSVSNFAINVLKNSKRFAYTGINIFTLRQVTSRIQGAYVTLWAVCVILFFAITIFSTGLGLSSIFAGDIKENTLFDESVSVDYRGKVGEKNDYKPLFDDIKSEISRVDNRVSTMAGDSVQLNGWSSGMTYEEVAKQAHYIYCGDDLIGYMASTNMKVVSIDEINKLRSMLGRDKFTLSPSTYGVLNASRLYDDFSSSIIKAGVKLKVGNVELTPGKSTLSQPISVGGNTTSGDGSVFVVPADVARQLRKDQIVPQWAILDVNYANGVNKSEADKVFDGFSSKIWTKDASGLSTFVEDADDVKTTYAPIFTTMKTDIEGQSMGLKVLLTYLAIYIGFVLLFSVASLLAIQQLCSTLDSVNRYRTLAQIGAGRKAIFASLFKQIAIYFMAPLIPAICHYACTLHVLNVNFFSKLMVQDATPVISVCVFILAIYGLYMYISYSGSKNVIKSEVGYRLLS